MKESDLWKYIRQGMLGKWHVSRIESSAGNGVPDVSFGIPGVNGWIELKYIKEWPKRPTTKVKLPLRPEQKHWIKNRGQLSGNVWVLVRISDDFFLLYWNTAVQAAEKGMTQFDWFAPEIYSWHKEINFSELYDALSYT